MQVAHAKPTLTMFADASLYVDRGVAGWGGWARGDDRQPAMQGGPSPFDRNSTVAELWALALFAERLREDGYMTEADRSIILQSDSLHALQIINARLPNSCASSKKQGCADIKRAKSVVAEAEEPVKRLAAALDSADVIYLRHVKGHQGGKHARSWVNEQCDRRAKQEARAQMEAKRHDR